MEKTFPTFSRHNDVSCFNYGQDFGPAYPARSGNAEGRGEYLQTCEICGMSTWYDMERKLS